MLSYKNSRRPVVSTFLVVLALFSGIQPAKADDPYFTTGAKLFKQGNFKKALPYLQQSYKNNPYGADGIYYLALCYQHVGDNKNAINLYATLVDRFSYSDAGKLGGAALSRLDPEYYRQLMKKGSQSSQPRPAPNYIPRVMGGSAYSQSADLSSLPSEARVYFEHDTNQGYMVDALINNRSMKMVFDTGAEMCVFGKNQLREMGIPVPTGPPAGQGSGVGSTGGIDTWFTNVDLKVGQIDRKNFRIAVHENLPTPPLLGQTFYRDFQYTIDGSAHNIHFIRKNSVASRGSASGGNAVPFRRAGNNIIVDAEVNGRRMTMFYDTGASSIAFSEDQAKAAGLRVPEDAQVTQSIGVGGATTGFTFPCSRIKLGPIERSNVMVTTVGAANMPYPLLGAPFFEGWEVQVDNENSVLRCLRR